MQEQGTLIFPLGTNGNYVSAAKFMNARTVTVPTNVESGFKIEPMALADAIDHVRGSRAWVFISGPTINPSGFVYSNFELEQLLSICASCGARVMIDTSFSGMEFQTIGRNQWDLERCLCAVSCLDPSLSVVLLGELSLGLSTAGLDFGFLILNNISLFEYSFPSLSRPHSTLKYTFRKLLGLKNRRDQHFSNFITEQKETLKNQANQLIKVSLL
jgi:methionine S-methyltransferase